MVKNLPAMQETQIQSLGWENSPGDLMRVLLTRKRKDVKPLALWELAL